MKALVMSQPGFAEIQLTSRPEAKGGEVLLRVRMVGLCGSDLNSFRGSNPLVSFPRIPGHEIAGTIVENKSDNLELKPGTNVAVSPYSNCGKCAACQRGRVNACQFNQTLGVQRDGALTEFITVSADRVYPAQLSLKELCLVEPLTVGFHAVARGRVTNTDIVAVWGCGGVGLGAVAAASFEGAKTIAVDIDEKKLEIARKAGAAHTINASKESVQNQLADFTDGAGPDVVIEAIGSPETFRTAVEVVAFTGRVVYVGYAKAPVAYETHLFVQKELDIMGSRNAMPPDFRKVIQMLEAHRFPVEDAITRVVTMERAPDMLRAWRDNPAAFTKIVIDLE